MESNIRKLRVERHITQSELADVLGLTQQMVSRMEKDRSRIRVKTLIMLADYFQVSTDMILNYQPPAKVNRNHTWPQTGDEYEMKTPAIYDALVSLKKCLEECGI